MLVIQGFRGTPNGVIGVQVLIFMDFRVLWGVSRGPLWKHVCDFSLIWGVEMGDGFQVHVFSDPGMEMMPECSGCMCYKHSKNNGFYVISLFPFIQ